MQLRFVFGVEFKPHVYLETRGRGAAAGLSSTTHGTWILQVCVCFTLFTGASFIWPEAFAGVAPPPLAHAAASVQTRAVFTLVSVAASRCDVGLQGGVLGPRAWQHQPRVHKHVSEAAQKRGRALGSVPTPATPSTSSSCSNKEALVGGSRVREAAGLLVQRGFSGGHPPAGVPAADQPDEAEYAAQGGFHPVPPAVGQELGQFLNQGAGSLTPQAAEAQTSLRQLHAEDQLVHSVLHQGPQRSV